MTSTKWGITHCPVCAKPYASSEERDAWLAIDRSQNRLAGQEMFNVFCWSRSGGYDCINEDDVTVTLRERIDELEARLELATEHSREEDRGRVVMDTQQAQATVAAAVVARGYRDGWTAEQFAARQVAKMVEELGEMAHHFGTDDMSDMSWFVEGDSAKSWFDSKDSWDYVVPVSDPHAAYDELCDVVVVCLVLGNVLSEIIGQPLDVVADAVKKATQDIPRGTRA